MYRRYIIVGIVFFILIGAYFIFFDSENTNNEYEKYYKKLVEREEFATYLDDVNLNIEEIEDGNSKYSYIVTFDGVNEDKNDIKILVLDEKCSKEKMEKFPSFGIIANKGYSLVKDGNENEEKKLLKGVNLTIIGEDKIDYFIIYFSSDSNEQFVKVEVSTFLD
jgi:hypothetical protein